MLIAMEIMCLPHSRAISALATVATFNILLFMHQWDSE
jgi:hypothetical protein